MRAERGGEVAAEGDVEGAVLERILRTKGARESARSDLSLLTLLSRSTGVLPVRGRTRPRE